MDADRPTNAPRLGAGSVPAAPRPAARRRSASRPPSPGSPPRKRRRNPPPGADRRRRLRPPAPDTPSELSCPLLQLRDAQGRWGLHRTGQSQPSARAAPETENRFGWAGASGRPACAAGTTQRNTPQIAADRGEDGDPISPDHNNNNRTKSAISAAQGEVGQPEHDACKQCPGRRSAREAGYRATHQPYAADDHNQTRAPSKPPPWALACPP